MRWLWASVFHFLSWAVSADGAGVARGLVDSSPDSQREEVWIHPGTKGHLSFLSFLHVSRCNPASTGISQPWPEAVPRAGKFPGQESANKTLCLLLTRLCLFAGQRSWDTSLSLHHPAKSASPAELPSTDPTPSGDLDCTFFSSPERSLTQRANFTQLGQLQ